MAAAAKTADDDDAAAAPAAAPVASKRGGVGLLLGAVLASAAASAGVSWLIANQVVSALKPPEPVEEGVQEPEPEIPKEPANYVALEPAFIVNLDAGHSQRFLQVQVEVMTRDRGMVEKIQLHAPRIRSALLLLFGQQKPEDLATRAGKERLQAEVLAEIQEILVAETGESDVEAVYFTSFVMQ